MAETIRYSIVKTAGKAAPSIIVLVLVRVLKIALDAAGVAIDDATLYTIAIAGIGAVTSFINWLKHRKDGKTENGK